MAFNKSMKFIAILVFWLTFVSSLHAQKDTALQSRVNRLAYNAIRITYSPIQEIRKYAAASLYDSLEEILSLEQSYLLSFDSFKNVSVLASDDDRVKIFTWNYISDSGYFTVYGCLLLNPKYHQEYFYALKPFTKAIDTNYQVLNANNWYPALYYDIFQYKYKRKCYYLLTGFNGTNPWLDERLVEILHIDKRDGPQFGLPVFFGVKEREKPKSRLVFKYATEATMVCRVEKKDKVLVVSHLVPVRWQRHGDFEYYAPDGTYDVFRYKKGKWQRFDMPMNFQGNQRERLEAE